MVQQGATVATGAKFQPDGDRRSVPWIKVYTELNSDPEWLGLSTALRGMLVTIWLEYARSRGQLPLWKVMQLCGKSARSVHIESLNHAGFIALCASKPLALARSREVEVEEEKKKTYAHTRKPAKPQPVDNSAGRSNVQAADGAKAVEVMIRNRVITDPVALAAEIAGYHLDPATATRLRGLLQ